MSGLLKTQNNSIGPVIVENRVFVFPDELPQDIFMHFFEHLKVHDLLTTRSVCKQWKMISDSPMVMNSIWKRLFDRDFTQSYIPFIDNDFKRAYIHRSAMISNFENQMYLTRFLAQDAIPQEFNIIEGRMLASKCYDSIHIWDLKTAECLKSLRFDQKMEMTAWICFDGKIAAGRKDGQIVIWDSKTYECIEVLNEHTNAIQCLVASEGKFVASSQGKITICESDTLKCVHVLEGHQCPKGRLLIANGKLISAPLSNRNDSKIGIADLHTGQWLCTLNDNEQSMSLNDLLCSGDKLIVSMTSSFPSQAMITIFDLEDYTCLRTIEGKCNSIYSMNVEGEKIVACCVKHTTVDQHLVKIWDMNTEELLTHFKVKGRIWNPIIVDSTVIFSSLNKVSICDMDTAKPLQTFERRGASALALAEGMIISGSCYHSAIEIWDTNISSDVIFEEMASSMESSDRSKWEDALSRFSKMPEKLKIAIYDELLQLEMEEDGKYVHYIFPHCEKEFWPVKQLAQAFRNYSLKLDVPLFLGS